MTESEKFLMQEGFHPHSLITNHKREKKVVAGVMAKYAGTIQKNKKKIIQDIIISGPLASGKSWIADAIAMTHKNVIETTPGEIYDRLETSINNLSDQYSLLIIDDCKISEIQDLKAALDDCFQKFDNWSGKWLGSDCIPTIFLTQDHVKKQEFENQNFKIIYCNYNENVL